MTARVLIVEDEPDIVLMLRIGLELHGYAVASVRTGEEALSRLGTETFDVVLLDIRLPGMDGWGLLSALTAEPPEPAPLIVMLSAHSSLATADRAMRMGCADYVTKPFEIRDLRERIAALLEERNK